MRAGMIVGSLKRANPRRGVGRDNVCWEVLVCFGYPPVRSVGLVHEVQDMGNRGSVFSVL